ncbi:MAG: hypothetical protein RRA51_02595 [Armatimonadota bacterium]|nr:hypothetical protein [Armatimonadota bacterium]
MPLADVCIDHCHFRQSPAANRQSPVAAVSVRRKLCFPIFRSPTEVGVYEKRSLLKQAN